MKDYVNDEKNKDDLLLEALGVWKVEAVAGLG